MNELIALLDGREVGRVRQLRGRLSFSYAPSWREAQGAYPLSLSMPLASAEHPHSAIEPFLWGLLPDNEFVLQRWASQFQISARNAFGLIAQVGEDCAGAVQFLTPERFETLQEETTPQIQPLTEAEIASRLRALKVDASVMRSPRDLGQFSLAGAQPKTALLFDGKQWAIPSGRTPTTHILKPTTLDFDGHAENEHFCLLLARSLGLPTALTEVQRFEDVTAIVVTRYDRVDTRALAAAAADAKVMGDFSKRTPIYRVHQEDFCQSLGIHPARKYQNEGGPGPLDVVKLLRASAGGGSASAIQEDIDTFVRALIFNWLIGGTDAHAKNYSILIGGNGLVRLAPLYDISSIYAYPDIDPLKAKLAMKIGNDYRLRDIGLGNWGAFASEMRLPLDVVIGTVRSMVAQLPDAIEQERDRTRESGLTHPAIHRLTEALTRRLAQLPI